jgi:hypothetical protein
MMQDPQMMKAAANMMQSMPKEQLQVRWHSECHYLLCDDGCCCHLPAIHLRSFVLNWAGSYWTIGLVCRRPRGSEQSQPLLSLLLENTGDDRSGWHACWNEFNTRDAFNGFRSAEPLVS